jgi:acyl-CoA synthetase (AMP-forming)/AMP-acid ligase II
MGGMEMPQTTATAATRLDLLGRRRGDRAGFLDAGTGSTLTWSEAARHAADWTGQLPPGTVVALHIASPLAFCCAYLAGLAAGVCVAPLDPRAPDAELAAMLELVQAADVVVDTEDAAAQLAGSGATIWITSATGLRRVERGTAARLRAPGVAALLPTSGTTGSPKLVPLTEEQLLRVAGLVAGHHALTPADRGYSPLPLFHVNAQVVGVLSTLISGGSLVVDDRFHRSRFWTAADELGVTWLNLVPAILGILGDGPAPRATVTRRVRFARSASAPLPTAVRARFEARSGIGVLETYGMTEGASQIAASPLAPSERRPGSVGLPVGVAVRIAREDGVASPADQVGAVELRGPNVIDFYLGAGRTRIPARDSNGWLHTGDLALRDARGFIYLAGRGDDVINRGGEKVHPRAIEEVLLADARVRSAAVVGRPHWLLGEEPVAFVAPDARPVAGGAAGLAADLLARCSRALSPHKQPASVIVLPELPAGRTGKPDRRALRTRAATEPPDGRATATPGRITSRLAASKSDGQRNEGDNADEVQPTQCAPTQREASPAGTHGRH